MVIHINLGGRLNEFDQKTLNVKHVFGPYAVLLDKNLKPVPLKLSGEPLEPLKDNETFTVQITGLGPQGRSVIEKAKKQHQIKIEKDMQSAREAQSQVISLATQPPNLVVTDKARRKIEKRAGRSKPNTEAQDCDCDCWCLNWFSKSSKSKSKKKDKYKWTPLTEVQEESRDTAKAAEKMFNAAFS